MPSVCAPLMAEEREVIAARVRARAGETELVEQRTLRSKTFRHGMQIRTVTRVAPLHFYQGGSLVDVDPTPVSDDGGVTWRTTSTPYTLLWDSETATLTYTGQRGGDIRVRLAALDDVPVAGPFSVPTVTRQSITAMIVPGLELELRVQPFGVELLKHLLTPTAPRALTWEVVAGDVSSLRVNLEQTTGTDNPTAPSRQSATGPNRRRTIELLHDRTPDDLDAHPGKTTYTVTERVTGRTRVLDPETRAPSWVDDIEWPVDIDVTVSESVVANDDDGAGGATSYWRSGNNTFNTYTGYYLGVRFQTVAVPQGQTITSAIMTVNRTGGGGSTGSTLKGNAVDDAAAWADYGAFSPNTMAQTTASVNLPILANGIRTVDVTTICQEIFNRAGWVNNNDLRIGNSAVPATRGEGYQYFEDYQAAGTAEAELTIIYTAGGAAFMPLPNSPRLQAVERSNTY